MNKKELDQILVLHQKWTVGDSDGKQADLRGADLRGADLWGADMRGADLRGADMRRADLREANLSNTILDGINWLAYIGIQANTFGEALGYKLINERGEGIFNGGINYLAETTFTEPKINLDIQEQCGSGINLATFHWVIDQGNPDCHRILVMKFDVKDAVCPVASDGKFRVKKCTKIGEINFKGEYIDE